MTFFRGSLSKPTEGSACNGCGYCCAVQPCGLAQEYLGAGDSGARPALEVGNGGKGVSCGMVQRPYYYIALRAGRTDYAQHLERELQTQSERELASVFAASLGVGMGCDSTDTLESAAWPWMVRLVPVQAIADFEAQEGENAQG